jgi:hypothetical protein
MSWIAALWERRARWTLSDFPAHPKNTIILGLISMWTAAGPSSIPLLVGDFRNCCGLTTTDTLQELRWYTFSLVLEISS